MAFFGDKKEEKTVQPASTPELPAKKEKKVRIKKIPSSIVSQFTDEEKALYTKDIKTLTADDAKKLTALKIKITKAQGRILQRKIEKKESPKVSNKQISLAKFVFAESIVKTEDGKKLLKFIAENEQFSTNASEGLEMWAKTLGMDLKFKVKPKAEKKQA